MYEGKDSFNDTKKCIPIGNFFELIMLCSSAPVSRSQRQTVAKRHGEVSKN